MLTGVPTYGRPRQKTPKALALAAKTTPGTSVLGVGYKKIPSVQQMYTKMISSQIFQLVQGKNLQLTCQNSITRVLLFFPFSVMCEKNTLGTVAFVLVLVGALNWGLVGLGWLVNGADWNVVHKLLGSWMQVEAIVYVLVGLAGVYKLTMCSKGCASGSCCDTSKPM